MNSFFFRLLRRALPLLAVVTLAFVPSLPAPAAEAASHVYQCPMHPWIKSDHPGKCTVCGMDLVLAASGAAATSVEGLVALPRSSITAIGIETAVVSRQSLTRTVRVNGTIDDDDTRHRLLTAWVEGRIEKLYVNLVGAPVTAGQPLYDLYSPALQTAQREFVQIARAGDLAAGALPAARARLEKMGLTAAQLDELVHSGEPKLVTTILAPDGGTVVEKDVYEGQWLKEGDKLFAIADFSKMWFLFDAYEQDIAWLHLGQKAEISTRSVPGEVIEAPIDFIDPNFNESTHTTKVRVVLPNPHFGSAGAGHTLYHRVAAEARVLVESPAVLAAPRSAVLDAGNGPIAFVDAGDGNYQRRPLKLGRRGDALVEVIDGLKEGEHVVTSGALLLDAQAQLAHEAMSGGAQEMMAMAPKSGEEASAPSGQETEASERPALPEQSPLQALATAATDAADALASDDFVRYQKIYPTAVSTAKAFPDLPKLELGDDLKAARRSFEPWSTAVADLLRPHRAELGLKVFQCPMAPVAGTGRWVQRHQPLKNPFYGSAMPDCGVEVR
jgi:Cu(I)/Ag(I) efflux system membrane fusion protein